jgi:hypothetical protein
MRELLHSDRNSTRDREGGRQGRNCIYKIQKENHTL